MVRDNTSLDTPTYFDGRAPGYWSDLYEGTARNHHQLLLRRRREIVRDMLPRGMEPALELGCGPGVLIDAFASSNRVYLGDIAFNMVQQAKRRAGRPASTAAQMSAVAIPFQTGSLRLVTAMGLLQYVEDEERCLSEIARVLAPGGVAIITFPAPTPVEHALRDGVTRVKNMVRRLRGAPPGGPAYTMRREREHRRDEARRLLEEAGFEVEAARAFHYFFFPWNRVFFAPSRALDAGLAALQRTIPGLEHVAQSWVFKARRRP